MIQEQIKDAYVWCAIYADDTLLAENAENCFADVDQSRATSLLLIRLDGGLSHRVDVPPGATPIFFRRRSIEINLVQEASVPRPTVHCIGWKRGDEACYLFVFDDGSTLLTSDLQAV